MKYTKELVQEAATGCNSIADILRYFGKTKVSGGACGHMSGLIKKWDIDISHFEQVPWNKGTVQKVRRLIPEAILVYNRLGDRREPAYILRRALVESGVNEVCSRCGVGKTWNSEFLRLEVNHIDGDFLNNRLENLEFLCPNCHSQTKTYKSKNRKRG